MLLFSVLDKIQEWRTSFFGAPILCSLAIGVIVQVLQFLLHIIEIMREGGHKTK